MTIEKTTMIIKNNILENDDDVADDNPIKVIVILE